MDISNLSQLEGSVSKMLEMNLALQKENRQLRTDREGLLEKNKLAGQKSKVYVVN
jgi:regulator of replication initiation timing